MMDRTPLDNHVKTIVLLFLLAAALGPMACGKSLPSSARSAETPHWRAVGGAGFSAHTAAQPSLAIDGGVPYVVYQDAANSHSLTVMKYTGNWTPVGALGFTSGYASNCHLAFNGGAPYVAYQDTSTASNTANVVSYSGGVWSQVGGGTYIVTKASPVIAFDSVNTPWIAYADGNSGNAGSVLEYTSGAWSGITGFAVVASAISLAAYNTDIYVAYSGSTPFYLTVKVFHAGSWSQVGTSLPVHPNATSIAFDNSGNPYVAFEDATNGDKLSVAKYSGGAWSYVGSADFTTGAVYYPQLVFNNGTPYVCYEDAGNGGQAALVSFNGSSWVPYQGVAYLSPGTVQFPTLAFNGTQPYVAFEDGANSDRATVMTYY
jgi:hypothetical protein